MVQRLFKNLANANRSSLFLIIWMALAPLITSSTLSVIAVQFEGEISGFRFIDLLIVYVVASLTMALALTPTTFIALMSGFFIGLGSIPYVVLSYQAASVIGYLLARKIDHGTFAKSLKLYPKAYNFLEGIGSNQFQLVLLSRISPVLPFAIMNVVLSAAGVQIWKFFWGGLIGMLPRTLLFLWVGTQASQLSALLQNDGHNRQLTIGTIILLVFSILGLYLYFLRLVRKQTEIKM